MFLSGHPVSKPSCVNGCGTEGHMYPKMRVIDPMHMHIIHHGKAWSHEADPCSRDMIRYLERNESIVSWLQPEGRGIQEQVPCIIVGSKFCALSLRMMKAIFRHVRLRKNFQNIEPLSQGGFKLKIPNLLLQEKIRTQNRFNVGVYGSGMLPCLGPLYLHNHPHPKGYAPASPAGRILLHKIKKGHGINSMF